MAIDPLIERLAGDLKPVRRRSAAVDGVIAAVVGGVELALLLGFGMMRPDMPMAETQPSFWWKLGSLGLIAAISGTIAILSFDPSVKPRPALRGLIVVVGACLLVGWSIDVDHGGLANFAARIDWHDGIQCVTKMTLLSLPAIAVLGLLMNRGASTDGAATAFAVGLAAAAWGAFVFVFACPYDDPLYIAVWYAVGCGIVTLLGRLILPVLTRW